MDNLNSKTDVNLKNLEDKMNEDGLCKGERNVKPKRKKRTRDSSMKKMKEGNFRTN